MAKIVFLLMSFSTRVKHTKEWLWQIDNLVLTSWNRLLSKSIKMFAIHRLILTQN